MSTATDVEDIYYHFKQRAEAAEARVKELEAQNATLRAALERLDALYISEFDHEDSTPIEIVRESLAKLQDPFVMFHARPEKKAFTIALASVLADAERYKALELAEWLHVSGPADDRDFRGRNADMNDHLACTTLSELADRLREGAT